MRFGEIRKILDYHTECCRNCDEGSYEYCAHPDCDTHIARIMREEIMALLDKEEVKTDSLSCIPCPLHFRGVLDTLPLEGVDGELWYLSNVDAAVKSGNYYWYDGHWNYLAVGDSS